jgi:glycerate dehydrogenase
MNVLVFDGPTVNPGDVSWQPLERLGAVRVLGTLPREEVAAALGNAKAVFTLRTPLHREAFRHGAALQYVGVWDLDGGSHVNLAAAERRGVTVCRIPVDAACSIAEHLWACLLELARRVGWHSYRVRHGAWARRGTNAVDPGLVQISGCATLVIATKNVAVRLERFATAFGMNVQVWPLQIDETSPVPAVPLELWSNADVIIIHIPASPATERYVNEARLAAMKPGAWLIATGHGGVVDEQCLAAALRENRLGAAALDGLQTEPPPADHPLLRAPRCRVTPYHGWASTQVRQAMIHAAAANLQAFLDGRPEGVWSVSTPNHASSPR